MEALVSRIFQNWNIRRFIGLIIGLFVAIQALIYKDPLLGVLSAFFLFQIVTNTGCFGAGACSIPYPDSINESKK